MSSGITSSKKRVNLSQFTERVKADGGNLLPFGDIRKEYYNLPALVKGTTDIPRNLLKYSEQFDNNAWTKNNTTILANTTTDPLGGSTADKIQEDTTTSGKQVQQLYNSTIGLPYTFSIYLKAAERTWALVYFNAENKGVRFDLTNGVVGTTTNATGTITSVGSGWYRCSITIASAAVTTLYAAIYTALDNTSSIVYAGTTGSGLYMWGAQLEVGSTMSTYQPQTDPSLFKGSNTSMLFMPVGFKGSKIYSASGPSRNLLKYTEQFDNAIWLKGPDASVVANQDISPDGNNTADKITFALNASTGDIRQVASTIVGNTYTFSVWIKGGTATSVAIFITDASGNSIVSSGQLTLNSTWQRFTLTGTSTTTTSYVRIRCGAAQDNLTLFTWGAQLEKGSVATPYEPVTDVSDWTFSRGSLATMMGSNGQIRYAPHNLIQYSEQVDNAIWTKNDSTITANQITAPDGTLTADLITEGTAGNASVTQTFTGIINTPYIFSKSFKKGNNDYIRLVVADGTNFNQAWFNINTGVKLSSSFYTSFNYNSSGITDMGNGWYRCWIICSLPNTAFTLYSISATADNVSTRSLSSTRYEWGASLNQGITPSEYMQTTSAAVYGPRFEYGLNTDTTKGGITTYKGLLIEKVSTNIITYSEQVDNAAWGKTSVSVTPNAIAAPDGTTTADKIIEDTSANAKEVRTSSFTGTGSVDYTISCFARAGERNFVRIGLPSGLTGTSLYCVFNLTTGNADATSGTVKSYTATQFPSGWWKFSVTGTSQASPVATTCFIGIQSSATLTSYTGDGVSGIYIWGAQLEQSGIPTSYIPTTTASVTRAGESITSSSFTQWYNEPEGTWYSQLVAPLVETGAVQALVQVKADASNYCRFRFNNYAIQPAVAGAGNTVFGTAYTGNTLVKVASVYKLNDYAITKDGAVPQTNTTNSVPTGITTIEIGSFTNFNQLNSNIRSIAYFNTRRTNSELQTLTQ